MTMTSNFIKSVKRHIATDPKLNGSAAEALQSIASDLRAKREEASNQREKVQNAIANGTKLTKRRIPL